MYRQLQNGTDSERVRSSTKTRGFTTKEKKKKKKIVWGGKGDWVCNVTGVKRMRGQEQKYIGKVGVKKKTYEKGFYVVAHAGVGGEGVDGGYTVKNKRN